MRGRVSDGVRFYTGSEPRGLLLLLQVGYGSESRQLKVNDEIKNEITLRDSN